MNISTENSFVKRGFTVFGVCVQDGWIVCWMGNGKSWAKPSYKIHLCAMLREIQGWYACSIQENERFKDGLRWESPGNPTTTWVRASLSSSTC